MRCILVRIYGVVMRKYEIERKRIVSGKIQKGSFLKCEYAEMKIKK